MRGASEQFLIWHWYWLAGHSTSSDVRAKLQLALQRLTGASDTASWVAVYTPVGDDVSAGARRLNAFVEAMSGPIDNALEATASAMIDPNRPLLIAHVVYRFDIGGLENGVVNLINRLPESSWRHAVLALTEVSSAFTQRVQRQDVQYLSLRKSPGHLWKLYPRLVRMFRELQPAVVHTRNLAALEAVVPAWAAGVPARIHGEHGRDAIDPDGVRASLSMGAPSVQSVRVALCCGLAGSRAVLTRARGHRRRPYRADLQRSRFGSIPSGRQAHELRSMAARFAVLSIGWSAPWGGWTRSRISARWRARLCWRFK